MNHAIHIDGALYYFPTWAAAYDAAAVLAMDGHKNVEVYSYDGAAWRRTATLTG